MRYLLLLAALFSSSAYAGELRLLDPKQVSMEFYNIESHVDQYFDYADPDDNSNLETWKYGVAALIDFDAIRYGDYSLYMDNTVRGQFTDRQVREIGWQFEVGVHITEKLDVFHYHYSRHVIEDSRDYHFPLDDWTGVRLNFVNRKD